ncbi:M48 family metalloprotease [Ralstonia pseudosolanacearum]|uniref:M48 family metalloprotease n=1 Tax=Ralstonia pseudosolanacearum TaxID=1310165 RepID=UPI00399A156A
MDALRLDQLKFPDETKAGLALMIVYILYDVTQSATFNGMQLAGWLGFEPNARVVGIVQLVMLGVVLIGLVLWRRRAASSKFGVRRLADVDPLLAADAAYLANHIGRGRGQFLVTSNFDDANAFCLAAGRESWVVLGAGLRVLFRKQREHVRAILAHECSHLNNGDVVYVVIAWHLFCAYTLLAFANAVATQGRFWSEVPAVLPAYEHAGGLAGLIGRNVGNIFSNGISALVAIVGVWLLLRHFVQLREFRADERAAQAGFRSALVDLILSTSATRPGPSLRRLLTMHPKATARIERLKSEQPWARLDLPFLAGMAFLVVRIDNLLPQIGPSDAPSPTSTASEVLLKAISDLHWHDVWISAAGIALYVTLAFIVALHVYRVAVTLTRMGAGVFYRLSFLCPATLAVFVGGFLGEFSSQRVLARLASASTSRIPGNPFDISVSSGAWWAELYLLLAVAMLILAPHILKQHPKPWPAQLMRLFVATFGLAFILQVAANIAGYVIGATFGGLPQWDIPLLQSSNVQPFAGAPSLMQLFVILVAVTVALSLPRWLGLIRLRGAPLVDREWLTVVHSQPVARMAS